MRSAALWGWVDVLFRLMGSAFGRGVDTQKPPHCDVERLSGTLFCGSGHKTKTPILGVFYWCLMGKHRVDGAAVSVVEVIEVVAVSVVQRGHLAGNLHAAGPERGRDGIIQGIHSSGVGCVVLRGGRRGCGRLGFVAWGGAGA